MYIEGIGNIAVPGEQVASSDPTQNTQNAIDYEQNQFNLNRQYLADSMAKLGISPAEQQQVLSQWDAAPSHDAAMQLGTPYMQKYAASQGYEIDPTSWAQQTPGFNQTLEGTPFLPGALTFAALAAGMGGLSSLGAGTAGAGTAGSSIGAVTPGTFATPDLLAASQLPGSSLSTALGTIGAGSAGAGTLGGLTTGMQSYAAPTAVDAFSASAPVADAGEVVVGSGAPSSFLSTYGVPLAAGGLLGSAGLSNLISDSSLGSDPTPDGGSNGGSGMTLSDIRDLLTPGWSSLIGPAIGGISSLLGSNATASAARDAANTQADATRTAIAEQQRQFDLSRADQMPWLTTGKSALGSLASLLGIDPSQSGSTGYGSLLKPFSMADYTADPGYQFRLSQGSAAIDAAARARGLFNSGGTMKALDQYNSDQASQEYGNAYNRFNNNQTNVFNRLSGVAGTGQQTAQNLGSLGAQNSGTLGNLLTNQGNASAASQIAQGNARTSGYTGLANSISGYFQNQQNQNNLAAILGSRSSY